ncbi:hypothetical protein EDC04DRAFT_2602984 [Pisolithus marmoratus]|nr:hypothetical protein EDC04DRAFT_2602984 [Pisolithus marmoratus]
MSQNVANTSLPTPATTQDWTTIPEEAIQSASDDNKETANMKYAEHQCQKQSKVLVVDRPRVSAPVGDRPGMSVLVPAETGNPGLAEGSKAKGKAKAHDPVPVGPCAWCVRARVECTFKLVRASKHGKKSCDWCSGLKEQSIDWHTNEMVKHQEITKETQCMQRWFNDHLYKLLPETEYQQVAEVGELSDEESTGAETSDRETDKDTEGEEAPESDLESCLFVSLQGYHKTKTGSHSEGNKQEKIHEVVMSGVPVLEETYWNTRVVYQYL